MSAVPARPSAGVLGRRLDALIFDMDGTLIDSGMVVPDTYIACIAAAGGPAYSRAQIIDAYSLGSPAVMLGHLLGRPCPSDLLEDYHARLALAAPGITVYPGIVEALTALARTVPLAVFTGASRRACSLLIEAMGLARHFAALVGGDEVARPKPHPDGILLACERLGVAPESTAYIGDAPADLEAARRGGALALAAGWGHLYTPGAPADAVLTAPSALVSLVQGAA